MTPPPIREGGPELWIGAQSPAGVDRAARLADGFFCTTDADAKEWAAACDRHDRAPEHRHLNRSFFSIVDEDPDRAYAEAGPHFMHLMNEYIVRGSFGGAFQPFDDPDEIRRVMTDVGVLLCTDAAGALAKVEDGIAEGATYFKFYAGMPGEPVEQTTRRIRYLADKVAPHAPESDHPSAGKRPIRYTDLS